MGRGRTTEGVWKDRGGGVLEKISALLKYSREILGAAALGAVATGALDLRFEGMLPIASGCRTVESGSVGWCEREDTVPRRDQIERDFETV